jgi:filamentous hemagglutinin family protein
MLKRPFSIIQTLLLLSLLGHDPVDGQVIPDPTLSNPSLVEVNGNTITITGGTALRTNLFHSFKTFSLTGQEAYFNNSLNIENIFSRVTGMSPSKIDGLIRANGTANLFLINPSGIIFGPHARLNLGGAFLATTASSILFDNGSQYSAVNPSEPPILTINAPVGLVFQGIPGEIIGQGDGHRLYYPSQNLFESFFSPILGSGEGLTGLKVSPGSTLALIGGKISLDGMVLTAPSGNLEIAGISTGIVGLKQSLSSIEFDYENVSRFENLGINNLSLLDASGFGGGQIRLRGENLALQNGSLIMLSNFGSSPAGAIDLKINDTINLVGASYPTQITPSSVLRGIYSQSLSTGKGSDINLSAKNLNISLFSVVSSHSYGLGNGGNIQLNLDGNLKIDGTPPVENQLLLSSITSINFSQGSAGDITTSSRNTQLSNGALLYILTFGLGRGGNLSIESTESTVIENRFSLRGGNINSTLGTTTAASGAAGNIELKTQRLSITGGGQISSSTSLIGDAGNIKILATESIAIDGNQPNPNELLVDRTQIYSAALKVNPFVGQLFGVPNLPQGESGLIEITTPNLILKNGGLISVFNEGIGNAGGINLNASSINLSNQGTITASTSTGEGGNINIFSDRINVLSKSEVSASTEGLGNGGNISIESESLLLNEGQISAITTAEGNGGNLSFNTTTFIALRDSSVIANALRGNGGNINIQAKFYLASPETIISASSALGINGNIDIQTGFSSLEYILTPFNISLIPLSLPLPDSCLEQKNRKEVLELIHAIPPMPETTPSSYLTHQETQLSHLPANRLKRLADGRVVAITELDDNPEWLCIHSKTPPNPSLK